MILRWFKRRRAIAGQAQAKKRLDEFTKAFGEHVCPVCSLHRFGYQHGYVDSRTAPAHLGCVEARCVQGIDQNLPDRDTRKAPH